MIEYVRGSKLRDAREGMEITQAVMAKQMGMSLNGYGNLERNKRVKVRYYWAVLYLASRAAGKLLQAE